jgi:hypothetical protein
MPRPFSGSSLLEYYTYFQLLLGTTVSEASCPLPLPRRVQFDIAILPVGVFRVPAPTASIAPGSFRSEQPENFALTWGKYIRRGRICIVI